jgi:hypothetical protein
MTIDQIQPGVYAGKVTARSSDVPGTGHTYSVFVEALQFQFDNVAPTESLRWSTISPDIDLIPFDLGTPVIIIIESRREGVMVVIHTSELPDIGPCT